MVSTGKWRRGVSMSCWYADSSCRDAKVLPRRPGRRGGDPARGQRLERPSGSRMLAVHPIGRCRSSCSRLRSGRCRRIGVRRLRRRRRRAGGARPVAGRVPRRSPASFGWGWVMAGAGHRSLSADFASARGGRGVIGRGRDDRGAGIGAVACGREVCARQPVAACSMRAGAVSRPPGWAGRWLELGRHRTNRSPHRGVRFVRCRAVPG